MSRSLIILATALLLPCVYAGNSIPSFTATALTGQQVSAEMLLGQRIILIVTPSKDAAAETRQWAKALRDASELPIRDVIAIDLPFFVSFESALEQARDKVPERYHDQAWLTEKKTIEKALDIPTSSEHAHVFVLNKNGTVQARFSGSPSDAKLKKLREVASKAQ